MLASDDFQVTYVLEASAGSTTATICTRLFFETSFCFLSMWTPVTLTSAARDSLSFLRFGDPDVTENATFYIPALREITVLTVFQFSFPPVEGILTEAYFVAPP